MGNYFTILSIKNASTSIANTIAEIHQGMNVYKESPPMEAMRGYIRRIDGSLSNINVAVFELEKEKKDE